MRCDDRPLLEFLEARLGCRESAAVAEHVQGCARCRERVQVMAALIALNRDQARENRAAQPPRFLGKVLATAAAVLFTLLLGNYLWLTPQNTQIVPRQLATLQSYPYFPLETRGPFEEKEKAAFSAYAQQDYRRASALFGHLPPQPDVLFYQGVSLYLAGYPARALDALRDPVVMRSAWTVPSLWYQAHAFLKLNRPLEALEILEREEFATAGYREEAAHLKEKLRQNLP